MIADHERCTAVYDDGRRCELRRGHDERDLWGGVQAHAAGHAPGGVAAVQWGELVAGPVEETHPGAGGFGGGPVGFQ